MQLVFAAGQRPGVAALRRAVERCARVSISHDPAAGDGDAPIGRPWLELLLDGQTFDLSGLTPGPADPLVDVRTRLEATVALAGTGEAISLTAGPHLAGGRNTLPVVRAQAAMAAELIAQLPGVGGVAWDPARSVMGRDAFLKLVEPWLAGGPFPTPGLVALRETFGGDFQTEGLAFFTGQELHFGHADFTDRGAASRLAIRLVNHLVGQPPLENVETIALADGSHCVAEPSRNGRFLRISRG